ncbi:Ig-like domain (group 2) [Kandleria vitulina]|uniref:Ltp family lipoprotein n=1 Tax=Kandleria vitulina TaxID=1630 RepID=UPI0008BF105A|nr:Ltp family lipoprotein [Kandleria vitulina]SEJ10094.1 Ig-like domain (group 2) [Kandleria vitulina]
MKETISRFLVILATVMALTVPVNAATMKLNKKKATIYVGQALTLKVKGKKKKVKWKSTNKKVAKVNKKGKVTGLKAGKSTIIAKVGKKSLKCKVTVKKVAKKRLTSGQRNALASAKSYLSFSAFSKKGLKNQLLYEKYSDQDAQYAVDHCGANWYKQAYKSAKNYLSFMSFSEDELINQLEFEGFTYDQAVYGADRAYA